MRKALVDNVTEMLIEAWQKHQLSRPFNPDPDLMGSPPDFAIQQMNQWMTEDMSYRNIVGNRLATNALHISTDHKELDETADAFQALTPLDIEGGVERMARVFADLEPGESWPTNEELGGGLTGTRDDEYRHDCMDRARAALDALLGGGQE